MAEKVPIDVAADRLLPVHRIQRCSVLRRVAEHVEQRVIAGNVLGTPVGDPPHDFRDLVFEGGDRVKAVGADAGLGPAP